jgi:hypothetical protein
LPDEFRTRRQGVNPSCKIAGNMVKTDAPQAQRGLGPLARLGDQYNRVMGLQDGASPECLLPVQTNIETARQMSRRVQRWLTRIDHLGLSVYQAQNLRQGEWRQVDSRAWARVDRWCRLRLAA